MLEWAEGKSSYCQSWQTSGQTALEGRNIAFVEKWSLYGKAPNRRLDAMSKFQSQSGWRRKRDELPRRKRRHNVSMERRVKIGEESLSLRKEMAIEKSLCYRRLGIQSQVIRSIQFLVLSCLIFPCIGRWILYHWATWEVQIPSFSSVQSLSRVRLFATPWITACQASLSITNSRSSLRLTSIESVMPSSHLILCHPLLLLSPTPPSIRVFSSESTLHMTIQGDNYSDSYSTNQSRLFLSFEPGVFHSHQFCCVTCLGDS